LLAKWGSYNAEQIYNKTVNIETKVDTLQAWLNSFNGTEQQRYANLLAEVDDTEELLNLIRTEIGFNGTSYTAYSYLVGLDSKLVTINATILNKIEFDANRTITQITNAIQQNTTAILERVNANSNNLSQILAKWGDNTADSIIANITQNRNQITTMQAWLNAFNSTEAARHAASQTISNDILTWLGIFNITEAERHNLTQIKIDELYLQINNTKNLTNMIISQMGYSGKNSTLYDDVATIITKNNQIINLAEEINLTTHRIETTVLQINSTLNSVQSDTQNLLAKWSTYNMSYVYGKLDLMDSKLNTIGTNNTAIRTAVAVLEGIVNATRAEIGFNGTSITAYSYLVGLDSKLVAVNATILNKIEFEANATRQQIMNAIQANSTAIISEINANENKLDSILNKWGDENAESLLSNITENRNQIISMQSWLNAFNTTETARHAATQTLAQQIINWLGLFNNTEEYRYNQTLAQLQSIFNEVNDTEELSNQIITQLGYTGKSTNLYDDVQHIISQNVNITILVNEINLTTHSTREILNTTIRQKIDTSLSNTSALLTKWGNYSADILWQKTGAVETKLDTAQAWLNSFNATEQQRYSDLMAEVNDSEEWLSALREELNFTGKGITAYQYLVNLESNLNSVNSSLWTKMATEGNLTREQLINVISSNTSAVINAINASVGSKLNILLSKWGFYDVQTILQNITGTRNSVLTLESWLQTYLTGVNGTGAIKYYLENTLFNEVNDTEELSNQIIAQLGYSGSNTTLEDDLDDLANQQAFVLALAQEINLTTNTLNNKLNVINSTLNLAYNDTRAIISKFGNYNLSQIWTKLDNIEDYVLAINVTNTFNCNGTGCNITIDNTQVLQAVNNVRSELGFQGQSQTAYDYFVELESELITMDFDIQTKIETEHATTREQLQQAIISNTTLIINEINDNQNGINTLINKWGNYSAQQIISNISDVRTRVIDLNSWMLVFNDTEAARHATSQSLINNVLSWLGLFNQTEAGRHNLTQTRIDSTLSVANEIKSLSNTIIADVGYNGTGHTSRNDTIQLMNLIAVLTNMVGAITDTDYVDLVNGVNAIALPKQPTNTSVISVMSNITSKYTRVDYWDDLSNSWLVYNPAAPFGNTLANMTTNKVYWIYANATSRLYIK
jgi:hypothetical protein